MKQEKYAVFYVTQDVFFVLKYFKTKGYFIEIFMYFLRASNSNILCSGSTSGKETQALRQIRNQPFIIGWFLICLFNP